MKKTGAADLPLHSGYVPRWLADRMTKLGTLIIEALVHNYGKQEVLIRLSDPLWFQSFGAVLGMDWHSSGITTSVLSALKRGINPHAKELGICICGGRGKSSRRTPDELRYIADASGLDGDALIRASKLCAKIDNTAVQDGFQLYLHSFILTDTGAWSVIQQGMNTHTKTARRYHWSSHTLSSFVNTPHTAVTGENQGDILNLTAQEAASVRSHIVDFSREHPTKLLKELRCMQNTSIQKDLFADTEETDTLIFAEQKRSLVMPYRHDIRAQDIDLKRLGAVLATAYEYQPQNFETLLLTPGLGARTLQSLTLISEIIYGTPDRFTDPARFSFAHGGKDGHPFPVACKIYDESIQILHDCIEQSRLGYTDKSNCLERLHITACQIERQCRPQADFDNTVYRERKYSAQWGGKTVCMPAENIY